MVMKENKSNALKQLRIVFLALIVINLISNFFFKRFDLTQDKRYTLSATTLNIIGEIDSPLYIEVYLEGNFPSEFKRLQNETKQLLEEFSAYNSNIIFNFKNPIEKEETRVEKMKEFYTKGMQPLSITVEDKGKQSQEVVFPWAVASYGDRSTKVSLLKNLMGASTEEKVISSVQHLEFAFAEAINKISKNQGEVKYLINTKKQFFVDSLSSSISSPILDSIYKNTYPYLHINMGKSFNLNDFSNERERLTTLFRNSGVYHFSQDYIEFENDTTGRNNKMNTKLIIQDRIIKNNLKISQKPFNIYTISDVGFG